MALFVPNPDSDSVEDIIEELARELGLAYRTAEDTLIREIATRAARDAQLAGLLPTTVLPGGLTAAERKRQNLILAELAITRANSIKELEQIAASLVDDIRVRDLANRVVEIAAREGEAAAAAQLGFGPRRPTAPVPFFNGAAPLPILTGGSSAQAVAMVAVSLQNRLEVLNQRITRFPQDAFQRIVAIHSPSTILGVTTSRIQQAATVQRFLAEGIPAFHDVSGRRWTIGAYSEMAGRTSVNRAYTDAGVWRMQQSGLNLVTVVRGLDSCRKCADWAGAVLSTDGTTGQVTLPHATQDTTVTVTVRATVDQARNAGWGHPNCRCRLVAYFPGLTIPQGDTTYDEEGEKERAQQRALEREIRAAKRREATAINDTDRRRAAADVREAQANMRDFIKTTGRNRDSYREQLAFADGRGGTTSSPTAPTTTPPSIARAPRATTKAELAQRYGLDFGADRIDPHEIDFYNRFLERGNRITYLKRVDAGPMNDFVWYRDTGPIEVELKSALSPKYGSIQRAIKDDAKRGKSAFIIDLGDRRLRTVLRGQLSGYNQGDYPIERLWVMSEDGASFEEVLLKPKK